MKKIGINLILFFMALFAVGCGNDTNTSDTAGSGENAPQLVVRRSGALIYSGSGPYSFGNVPVTSTASLSFVVSNEGNVDLNISTINITGADAGDFSSNISTAQVITPGNSITISVTFTAPVIAGTKYAQINMTHDDLTGSENPFIIKMSANVVTTTPDINIQDNFSNNLFSGSGSKHFGSVAVGSNQDIIFTIQNLGDAALTVTSTTAGALPFSVTVPYSGSIAASGTATFTVRFAPSVSGYFSTTITVASSNDPDEASYTFTVSGNATPAVVPQEISLLQGTNNIASGGTYDFGDILVGSSSGAITFTVKNVGGAALGITSITRTSGSADFSNPSIGVTSVNSGLTTTFNVTFSPTSSGALSAVITIANDDSNEGTYILNVTGNGTAPAVTVKQGGTTLADGAGTYTYSNVAYGSSSSSISFTILNTGTGNLTLTDAAPNYVTVTGDFSIVAQPANATIIPGGNITFTIIFTPTATGLRTGTVTINNDSAAPSNVYTFSVQGTCVAPEVNVQNAVAANVADTGTQAVTNAAVNATANYTFTIQNIGATSPNLLISGISLSGAEANQYALDLSSTSSSISGGGSTTFVLQFKPTSIGLKTAVITILSNDDSLDGDSEENYSITVTATASGAPVITVKQGGTTLADGAGTYTYSNVNYGSSSSAITYTILNTGNDVLTLTSVAPNYVTVTGDFTVTAQPASSTIAAGDNITFVIVFTPTTTGLRTGTVTINNNSTAPSDVYTFAVEGTAVSPEINVQNAVAANVIDTGTQAVTDAVVNATSNYTFTIQNIGATSPNLSISGISLSGADSSQFALDLSSTSSSIAGGGSTTFVVQFKPTTVGAKTAVVTILSNDNPVDGDSEENYSITVTANATGAPVMGVLQNGTAITDGDLTGYDFGGVEINTFSSEIEFVIQNTGNVPLTLSGGPLIQVAGTNAAEFTVSQQPSTTSIAVSGSTTFKMKFKPTASGERSDATTTVSIISNDAGTPYTFRLKGQGLQTFVDSSDQTGEHAELAVVGTSIYIVYYDYLNGSIKFAKSADSGATWTRKKIDDVGDYGFNERNISIKAIADRAADGDDLYVLYYSQTGGDLKLAKSVDGGNVWSKSVVDAANDVGLYPSIDALAGAGPATDKLYISYYDATNFDLLFRGSTDGGTNWGIALVNVDSAGTVGKYTSIKALTDRAADGDDIYISYYDETGGNLKVATSIDGGAGAFAQIRAAISTNDVGQFSRVQVIAGASQNLDTVFVIGYDTLGDLIFNKSTVGNTAAWGAESTLDSTNSVGKYCSLFAVDASNLYVSYYDATNKDLLFNKSTNGGTAWTGAVIVDSSGDVGLFTSIGVNGTNDYIAFFDNTNAHLKFAKSVNSGTNW